MKNTYLISTNIFYKKLWILVIFILSISCNTKQTPPKPEFALDTPGGVVIESFDDQAPKKIEYYQIDENGSRTQEKIGVAEFHENQQEFRGGGLKDGKRNGKWYAFFPDGSVQVEAFYIDDIEHGFYAVYRENGIPYYKGHYEHGICAGTWYWYNENGKQTKKIKANKNTIACEYCSKCLQLKQK